MRILHVINGLDDGGAEGVLYRICKYDKEHEHIVLSMQDFGKYGTLLRSQGVEVRVLNISKLKTLPKAQRTRGLSSSCQSNFFRSYHKSWSLLSSESRL